MTAVQHLLDRLDDRTTLVTASHRLARTLHAEFNARQQAAGHTVWRTPDILAWPAWLERCWNITPGAATRHGADSVALLSAAQEQAVWEWILESAAAGEELLHVRNTARIAADAWQLMHAWQLSFPFEGHLLSDDVRAFSRWARRFNTFCEERGYVDRARLADVLAPQFGDGLPPPGRLLLAGFDEFTPQQQALLETLREAGTAIDVPAPEQRGANAVRMMFNSTRDEVRAAAHWVRGLLEQGERKRIGIVVPQLTEMRDTVANILDDVLQPAAHLPGAADTAPCHHISLGRPLDEYPLVHGALLILELAAGGLTLEDAGALLRSTYLGGGEEEAGPRSLLDARLRQAGELGVPLARLAHFAAGGKREREAHYACPILAERLAKLGDELGNLPQRCAASRWAEHFSRLVAALGWPGDQSLSSAEYQTVNAWRGVLGSLSSLDAVLPELDLAAALGHLRSMAASRTFQPDSPEMPVQVMGVLEAAGLEFEHLWVMGLHDEVWPAAPHPNPFLPLALLRRGNMPHASAARELEVARNETARLLSCAPEVVVSYPRADGERDLRPSPIIVPLPQVEPPAAPVEGVSDYVRRIHESSRRETITDCEGPAVSEPTVSGGSDIFKKQAACPFRAFAEHRLGARSLEVPLIGLDARARGTLVHRVLELVWQELGSHDRLAGCADDELHDHIDKAVNKAVKEMMVRRPQTFTKRFAVLERARLRALADEWLNLERRRTAFTVDDTEAKLSVHVAGIEVHITLDRIDVLPDGRRVIVDYKTSIPRPGDWAGERPDEPQLPLYSLALEGDVAAVLFGQIRPGEMALKGIALEEGIAPGVKPFEKTTLGREHGAWADLIAGWREVLEQLAREFRAGRAAVDPKRYPVTCQYCALTPLCRINEFTVFGADELLEESADG